MPFPLEDIAFSLDKIALTPRREGETAFPEIATVLEAVQATGRDRRIAEFKEANRIANREEAQHRKDHPEEYFHISEVLKEFALKKVPDVKTAV